MKTVHEWKKLLKTINFPNFNKSNNDEVMEYIFSDCIQREVLLTWIVIQLGADFPTNRVLKHQDIAEYFKKRRVLEESKVEGFVRAIISREEQEILWDMIFYFIKKQKHLLPQPFTESPNLESPSLEETGSTETFKDFSRLVCLEPLYKELDILKKIRKLKPSDIEFSRSSEDYEQKDTTDQKNENKDIEKNTTENIEEGGSKIKINHKPIPNFGEGDVNTERKMLISEKTMSGTWYSTPDGFQKVFVPVGAPPLGELDFDLRKLKIVCQDDSTPGTKKKSS